MLLDDLPPHPAAPCHLGVLGRNIARTAHLEAFLPEVTFAWLGSRYILGEPLLSHVARWRRVDGIASWGVGRPFNEAARRVAARAELPYVALEDGFVRSVRPGVLGEPGLSLVADPVGIYYDSTLPSRLERLIADSTSGDPGLLHRAAEAMALLRRLRVSKYNHAPDVVPEGLGDGIALVVDQRLGDVSVRLSGAGPDAFKAMLELAIAEHGAARVVAKVHPDAVVGGRGSCLAPFLADAGVRVVAASVNPWALLDRARAVYTVSSLLGFEALVAGVPVTCFGLPFYAGWGLTRDRLPCPRRTARVPAEQVFAAAYLRYSRYAAPVSGGPATLEATIRHLAAARDVALAG